ncbi:MAG: helix-turn-helix transcriptional regulator, partial [Bradyrhizobium sp.]|nr:helix-turn-helix transcriptional regulator [Bradyrhizobium sp.]
MQVPSTTIEFLDALKAKRGWTSDYQLWKGMGWKQTTVSSYRSGRAAIAGRHAVQIAEELGLPHAYVLACGNIEREKDPGVSRAWKAI